MSKAVIVIGSGGHAAVLVDMLKQAKQQIIAIVSPDETLCRSVFENIKHLRHDDDILAYSPDDIELVNGIGSVPNKSTQEQARLKVFRHFKSQGYSFKSVVASHAIVSPYAQLAEGAQIMNSAVIQAGAKVGENCIVNTGAIIEHDCQIAAHCHIAPGATLSGDVQLGEQVHVGTGASVIHSIKIGKKCVVGAGAVVSQNVPEDSIVYPAKSCIKGNRV